MAPPKRRRHSCSSGTSCSSEKRKRRAKRRHTHQMKHVPSTSRRRERSPSSDFEDYHHRHRHSCPKRHHHGPKMEGSFYFKRTTTSTDSYESDDYRYHRHRASEPHHHSCRRSSSRRSPFRSPSRRSNSRRKRISRDNSTSRDFHHHQAPLLLCKAQKTAPRRSPCSKSYSRKRISSSPEISSSARDFQHHQAPVSKCSPRRRSASIKKSYYRRRRISSSPDQAPVLKCSPRRSPCSRSYYRRRRITSSPVRKFQQHQAPVLICERKGEPSDSDVEVLEEKRPIKEHCRSSSKVDLNSHRWYEKSDKYFQRGKFNKAMKCINFALNHHKEEDELLSKIYSRRGTLYSLLEKPKCTFQAFIDWERGYIIDKNNMESRKNMSKVLFKGANKLIRMKEYSKALEILMLALDLDKRNGEASILIKILEKKLKMKKSLKPSVGSNPCKGTAPEKTLVVEPTKPKHAGSVLAEVQILNKLAELAVNENNYPRAIIYINKALRLHKEMPGEFIFRELFKLKENIMKNVTRHSELVSDENSD